MGKVSKMRYRQHRSRKDTLLSCTVLYSIAVTFRIFIHNEVRDLGPVATSSFELCLHQTLSAELRRKGLHCALLRGEHSRGAVKSISHEQRGGLKEGEKMQSLMEEIIVVSYCEKFHIGVDQDK